MATRDNLKAAFAGESQANRKYLAFAKKADADGYPQIAKLFRAAAEAAWRLAPSEVSTCLANAQETFARHDLMKERRDFLEILNQVDQLW